MVVGIIFLFFECSIQPLTSTTTVQIEEMKSNDVVNNSFFKEKLG